MAKQHWKGSVLLAPVPAALVSCGTLEEPNVLTIAWTVQVKQVWAFTQYSLAM